MNAHITDTSTAETRVWEMEVDIEDMITSMIKGVMKSIQHYNWNETYYILDPELLSAMNMPQNPNGMFPTDHDFSKVFKYVSTKRMDDPVMNRIPIREGFRRGQLMGFQFSRTQSYAIWPIDEKQCVKVNTDYRRNYLRHNPVHVGLNKYFDYIEKEGVIAWKELIDKPEIREFMSSINR